jgi:hypothetical protein
MPIVPAVIFSDVVSAIAPIVLVPLPSKVLLVRAKSTALAVDVPELSLTVFGAICARLELVTALVPIVDVAGVTHDTLPVPSVCHIWLAVPGPVGSVSVHAAVDVPDFKVVTLVLLAL